MAEPRLERQITIELEDGRQITAIATRQKSPREAFAPAFQAFRENGTVPEGFRVVDSTPKRSLAEKTGRAIARTSKAAKEAALKALDTPEGKALVQAMGITNPLINETTARFMIENAPLPESLGDVGRDAAITAAVIMTGGQAGVGAVALRALLPAVTDFTLSRMEGVPLDEAGNRAMVTTLLGGLFEGGRAGRGVVNRIQGQKFTQRKHLNELSEGVARILPEGAPRLSTDVATLMKQVDLDLPEFATKQFQRRLAAIKKLAGDSKIVVPSIDDQPIGIDEVIDVISGKRFKLNRETMKVRTGVQKLTEQERGQIIDEMSEGLLEQAPRNPRLARIQPIYEQARSERRDIGDIQRLLSREGTDSPFDLAKGRLDTGKLQQRVMKLRQPEVRGVARRNIDQIENIATGNTGPIGRIDQPNFGLDPSLFTRSGVTPGFGGVRSSSFFDFPRFAGTTQREFAAPISRAGSAGAVAQAAIRQNLFSAPAFDTFNPLGVQVPPLPEENERREKQPLSQSPFATQE